MLAKNGCMESRNTPNRRRNVTSVDESLRCKMTCGPSAACNEAGYVLSAGVKFGTLGYGCELTNSFLDKGA
jgi:hypothetical protein